MNLNAWRSFKDASQSLDPDESFLMEYVLTRGWMDPESEKIPTYHQIVDDSEDEEAVEAAEAFENRYNFRFEEEGGAEIVTHSRAIETSLRRKDDKRKKMREKKLARKSEEKTKKDQELMRLKNLKKEELRARLLRIQEVAGGGDLVGLEEVDLEKDFDPTDFDQKMGVAFGDPYYDAEVCAQTRKLLQNRTQTRNRPLTLILTLMIFWRNQRTRKSPKSPKRSAP